MGSYKCKNSVFCAIFLACFLVGTICGVFCFRCVLGSLSEFDHLRIGGIVFGNRMQMEAVFATVRPLGVMAVLAFVPCKRRYICILIVLRGFLMAYFFCLFLRTSADLFPVIFGEFLFLLLFFWLCNFVYFRQSCFCRID